MKKSMLVVFSLVVSLISSSTCYAALVMSSPGTITYVRTYDIGTGLRVQIGVSSAAGHTCGNGPTDYYFDSDKVSLDSVKGVLAIGSAALLAGRTVLVTYDCSLSGGGFGWGVALQMQ